MIVEVSTLDDERLDAYARLTEAQLRSKLEPERALFIAESGKVIERALAGGMEPLSLLMEEKWRAPMQPIIDEVAARWGEGVPVFVAPHDELAKLTGFELTRGALGAFRRPALPSVADVVAGARRIAVLEDITNHTNVGAIFRSAAALGVDAVLVTPACYDPLYRRAVRVSMGTVFQVPWTRIGTADVGESATSAGARAVGADADAADARAVDGRAADAEGADAEGEGTADVAGVHAVAARATGAGAVSQRQPRAPRAQAAGQSRACRFCTNSGSRRRPWRSPMNPCPSTTPRSTPKNAWPSCWAPKATASRATPSRAATTPCASPWPAAWIPSTWRPQVPWPSGSCERAHRARPESARSDARIASCKMSANRQSDRSVEDQSADSPADQLAGRRSGFVAEAQLR